MQDAQRTEQCLLHPRPALSAATDLQGPMTADGHAVPAQGAAPVRAGDPAVPVQAQGAVSADPRTGPASRAVPVPAQTPRGETRQQVGRHPQRTDAATIHRDAQLPAQPEGTGQQGQPQRQRKDQGPGPRIGRPAHRPRIPCSARSGADATGRDAPAGWPSSPADRCRNNTPGCPASGSARGHRATGPAPAPAQGPGPRATAARQGAVPKAGAGSRPAGPSASCARARARPGRCGARHPPPGHPRRPDSTDDCTRHCPPAAARPRTARA